MLFCSEDASISACDTVAAITSKPALDKTFAVPAPIPLVPPVTTTVLLIVWTMLLNDRRYRGLEVKVQGFVSLVF